MNRRKKLILNTSSAFMNQIVVLLIGFILPKLFLKYYGSEVNGLVSSITQFLSIIALAELGVGAVVQSSLYEPLAEKNIKKISEIIKSSQKFFNKLSLLFICYIIVLCVFYPSINETFTWIYVVGLILIISITNIAQYLFGITNQLLLIADQRNYIPTLVSMITLILNSIISVVLIIKGANIHEVKLISMVILLVRPLYLSYYVNKKYKLIKDIELIGEPIKQKWNGVAQHIASFILKNTDIIVLTVFSSLIDVSVYVIYSLITNGLQQLVFTLTNGMQALFGNMIANKEIDRLTKRFHQFEWLIHNVISLLFSCTLVLITPFVLVYTKGIEDANYNQPLFGILLVLAIGIYCLRLPYNIIILAAAHFKETQMSAIIEMILNLFLSIFFVSQYGLVGVTIGTLIAMTYRTIYLAYYLSNNIIEYKFTSFIKHIVADMLTVLSVFYLSKFIHISYDNYLNWFLSAILVFILTSVILLIINLIFYKKQLLEKIKGN